MIRGASDVIKALGAEYSADVDISGFSTIGLSSRAAYVVMPSDIDTLVALIREFNDIGVRHRIVGGMSNTMPKASYYDGVLIITRKINRNYVAEKNAVADCGARLSTLVRTLQHKSLGGIEALYHIPGTIGGSVRGNAGAHGVEISDVFIEGEFYDCRFDRTVTISNEEMRFIYRGSRVKSEPLVMLSCCFKTTDAEKQTIDERIGYYASLRSNQPRGVKTLGSTFKRVNGISAGYYIDMAGLKGYASGGAQVSDVHANFIVNNGGATPADVLTLVDVIKERVYKLFGVTLEEEIDYL